MIAYTLSEQSKKNREGVDSPLIEISDLAITLTVVDFGHPSDAGKRTSGRQNEIFNNSETATGCDGFIRVSRHQKGKALDFYAYVDGKASWEPLHLAMVACAFLQAASLLGYKLEWGGLWTSIVDMPHVQLLEDD